MESLSFLIRKQSLLIFLQKKMSAPQPLPFAL